MSKSVLAPVLGLVFAAVLTLGACSTPTLYQPAGPNGYGFNEQQIEGNRFIITFQGNSLTPRETVEQYLLYRAAELTLEARNDFFVIVREDTERDTTYRWFDDSPYYGWGPAYSWGGWYGWGGPHWGGSFGLRSGSTTQSDRYTAYATILMFVGQKPAPNVELNAYDAREVMRSIGPRILRPGEIGTGGGVRS